MEKVWGLLLAWSTWKPRDIPQFAWGGGKRSGGKWYGLPVW